MPNPDIRERETMLADFKAHSADAAKGCAMHRPGYQN
jgi:hypothetical protein